jgi:hypothetical protein
MFCYIFQYIRILYIFVYNQILIIFKRFRLHDQHHARVFVSQFWTNSQFLDRSKEYKRHSSIKCMSSSTTPLPSTTISQHLQIRLEREVPLFEASFKLPLLEGVVYLRKAFNDILIIQLFSIGGSIITAISHHPSRTGNIVTPDILVTTKLPRLQRRQRCLKV